MTAPGRTVPMTAVVVTVLAVLVVGCTSPSDRVAGAPSSLAATAVPSTPEDAPTGVAAECGGDADALDAVITEQLDAFAAGDWDRAFALTSREFRAAGVDADDLRRIVTSGYPEAADAADHEVVGCLFGGDGVQVLIQITATDGATLDLVYLLTRERGDWRVSGAVEHGTGPGEPTTTA